MRSLNIEYLFNLIYRALTGDAPGDIWENVVAWFIENLPLFRASGIFIALLALIGVIYSIIRLNQVQSAEDEKLKELTRKFSAESAQEENARWRRVLDLVASSNPGDWRIAILEADIMLDEIVRAMGYDGADLGERLKGIEKSDLPTLDIAWEAHKVRNRIAHSGSDFILTEREARRVIDLYKEVFEESHYI